MPLPYTQQPRSQLLIPRRGLRKPVRPALDNNDPINIGLIGCWLLGEVGGSNAIARDLSERNNQGTLTSGTTLAEGHHGGMSLAFDGSASFVSIPNTKSLTSSAISVVCWVKFSSLANAYSAVFSRAVASTAYYQLLVKSTGKLAVYVHGSANIDYDGTGSNTLSTGVWYCLAFTYDKARGLIGYVNGVQDGTAAANGALTAVNAITTIGKDTSIAGRVVNGRIEGVRQWDRMLTAAEIQRLYAEPYAGILESVPRWRVPQTVSSIVPVPPRMLRFEQFEDAPLHWQSLPHARPLPFNITSVVQSSKFLGYGSYGPPQAVDVSKLLGYAPLSPAQGVDAAKLLGYGALSPSQAVVASKFIAYGSLSPNQAVVASKLVAYAVILVQPVNPKLPGLPWRHLLVVADDEEWFATRFPKFTPRGFAPVVSDGMQVWVCYV